MHFWWIGKDPYPSIFAHREEFEVANLIRARSGPELGLMSRETVDIGRIQNVTNMSLSRDRLAETVMQFLV